MSKTCPLRIRNERFCDVFLMFIIDVQVTSFQNKVLHPHLAEGLPQADMRLSDVEC